MDCSEEAGKPFRCLICLDLLFKPIVQSCGHVFCFWCLHRAMDSERQSQCPVCRRPYIHFPRVCAQLHHFLAKAWPEEYTGRAKETEDMEENKQVFSPRIPSTPRNLTSPHKSQPAKSPYVEERHHEEFSKLITEYGTNDAMAKHSDLWKTTQRLQDDLMPNEYEGCDKLSIEDFSCTGCKQLLYRPVVLNCGQVFCELCVRKPDSPFLQCPSCESPHPGASVCVCLELHHYLEAVFPVQYQRRREETLKPCGLETRTIGGSHEGVANEKRVELNEEEEEGGPGQRHYDDVHRGVGCDGCGMFPIVGERYRCRDCEEKVGFDLCGGCHRSKERQRGATWRDLGGRFNQHHGPNHSMERVKPSGARPAASSAGGGPRVFAFDLAVNTLVQRRPFLQHHRLLADLDDYVDALL